MRVTEVRAILLGSCLLVASSCGPVRGPSGGPSARRMKMPSFRDYGVDESQVPDWSKQDLNFFLHGSIGTEAVPVWVLTAFRACYPDLFPGDGFSAFGLIKNPRWGGTIGVSYQLVHHLGDQVSIGMNCAACHVGEVLPASGGRPVRVLGMTGTFDIEAFFGAVTVAMLRTQQQENMKRFLGHYLTNYMTVGYPPAAGDYDQKLLEEQWKLQEAKIVGLLREDPFASRGIAAQTFHEIKSEELELNNEQLNKGPDLAVLVGGILKLFHNMRVALHIPDELPNPLPPASGPGRNNAWGLISASLFGVPTIYAPVKYGPVFNVSARKWVHCDSNTSSPLNRNLIASLVLGAPILGNRGYLDLRQMELQTRLSEQIRAPRYPFAIKNRAARRGAKHYKARCAACHTPPGPIDGGRLYSAEEIGTDPLRLQLFDQRQADLYNAFFSKLEIPGYRASAEPTVRSTRKYWAADLAGVWARSPYLHNGSVRTMAELLMRPADRPRTFRRGSRSYDEAQMGFVDDGPYVFDTSKPGNSNAGHDYGSDLSAADKRELIEYLESL